MKHRSIKRIHEAVREDVDDLVTRRALPTQSVKTIDPFLFLNHHGRQIYPPQNSGLPFGPHPHRGFETVTLILEGDISHKDSGGHESIIHAGGMQWMTAGRGLIHSETSSEGFKKSGGPLEILQLWVNLPASLKMTEPKYLGLQREEIPSIRIDQDGAEIQVIAGNIFDHTGPVKSLTEVSVMLIRLNSNGKCRLSVKEERSIFFYVVKGALIINGQKAKMHQLVEFGFDGEILEMTSEEDSLVLLCHANPLGEPVASYGPFVMNTPDEIRQAIQDYQSGKFS